MSTAPEPVREHYPEHFDERYPEPAHGFQASAKVSKPAKDEHTEKPVRACGLQGAALWIIAILAILLVGAIVGGAVGGSIAVRNLNHDSRKPANSTNPMNSTNSINSTIVSIPNPWDVSVLTTGCQDSRTITSHDESNYFRCEDQQGYQDGDTQSYLAYTVEMCVELCILTEGCVGADFAKDLAENWEMHHANCWLKNSQTRQVTGSINSTALTWCTDAKCEKTKLDS